MTADAFEGRRLEARRLSTAPGIIRHRTRVW